MGVLMLVLLGVVITTTFNNCTAGNSVSQEMFSNLVSEFDGRVMEKLFLRRTNGTASYCQMLCLMDAGCMSFFHNYITDTCQTQEVVFFNPSDGQSSPGSRYYRPVQDFCPSDLGYIYNRALNLCYKVHYLNPGDFDHARQACVNEGGDLIITDTKEKYYHIGWTITASTFPANLWPGFLIGATETGTRNWTWIDDKPVDEDIWTWCPGEPSCPGQEVSVVMRESYFHEPVCINDVGTDPKHFVCERKMPV